MRQFQLLGKKATEEAKERRLNSQERFLSKVKPTTFCVEQSLAHKQFWKKGDVFKVMKKVTKNNQQYKITQFSFQLQV